MKPKESKLQRLVKSLRGQLGEAEALIEKHVDRIQEQRVEIDEERARTAQFRSAYEQSNRALSERCREISNLTFERDDLKFRLHMAEVENARLKGFIDRVHEDDDRLQEPAIERIERPIVRTLQHRA